MANNKNKEAEQILRRIAKSNKKENEFAFESLSKLQSSIKDNCVIEDKSEMKKSNKIKISSIKSLLLTKTFLARTSVLILNW